MTRDVRRVRVRIHGRVQGVGFRWTAVHEATRRGLSGWVRNRPDGSVEALAEGESSDLEGFLAWCGRGPITARVDRTEVVPDTGRETLSGFHIHPG